jgi:tellurite methyltransferase
MAVINSLRELIGDADIYLLDQIMKSRYHATDKILDAGCGGGRNLHWFLQNAIDITGIDADGEMIAYLKTVFPFLLPDKLLIGQVEKMPFADNYFDHIISSAVLHFANSTEHFKKILHEMIRVLKSGGSLFIRMTSDIGIENKIRCISDGVYLLPDGSQRFLLTRLLLEDVMKRCGLSFLEPLKTVPWCWKKCSYFNVFKIQANK